MIQLSAPDFFRSDESLYKGSLHIPARDQRFVIESVTLTLTEHQYIGRGNSIRHLQHAMGQLVTGKNEYVKAGDSFDLSFSIPYSYLRSPAELAADNGRLQRVLIWLLRKVRGVRSEFYLTVNLKIKHDSEPFVIKKQLNLK
jgi:hypothetical protein